MRMLSTQCRINKFTAICFSIYILINKLQPRAELRGLREKKKKTLKIRKIIITSPAPLRFLTKYTYSNFNSKKPSPYFGPYTILHRKQKTQIPYKVGLQNPNKYTKTTETS